MDFYSASGIPILWCCFFQTIAIGWIFGVNRVARCVELMSGYTPNAYWIWTWCLIAPLVMLVRWKCLNIALTSSFIGRINPFPVFQSIFLFYCISFSPLKYGGTIEYPTWAHIIGFIMSLASMLWIPGYAIYYIANQHGSLRDVSSHIPKIIEWNRHKSNEQKNKKLRKHRRHFM